MRLILERPEYIGNAIKFISMLNSKSPVETYKQIEFRKKDGKVFASCADSDIKVVIPFKGDMDDDYLIFDKNSFLAAAKLWSSDVMEVEVDNIAKISVNGSELSVYLPDQDEANLHQFRKTDSQWDFEFYPTEVFPFISHAISKDELRPSLNSVNVKSIDDSVRFAATDGHRAAWRTMKLNYNGKVDVLIPDKAVAFFQILDERFQVVGDESSFIATSDSGIQFQSGIVAQKFPNLDEVIFSKIKNEQEFRSFKLDLEAFKDAVKKASSFNSRFAKAGLKAYNNEVVFCVKNEDLGVFKQSLGGDPLDDFEIALSFNYLNEAIRNIPGDILTVKYKDSDSMVYFGNLGVHQILMPIRLEYGWDAEFNIGHTNATEDSSAL